MKKSIVLCVVFSLAITMAILPYTSAQAATCNGVETSFDWNCDKYKTDSVSGLLMYIIDIMAVGVGIAVVFGLAWGGFMFASARDDTSKTKQGISIILNSVIGLLLFLGLYALANFFVPGGAFNLNKQVATPAKNTSDQSPTNTPSDSGSGGGSGSGDNSTPNPTNTPDPASLQLSDKIYNFRDSGKANSVIASGILYRSAHLANATSADITALEARFKGGTLIDLRSSQDISKDGADPKLTGITRKTYPIEATTRYEKFVTNADNRAGFGKALRAIATSPSPIIVHCSYGKDRTGWTIAMVMYALGASDDQVMSEFLASNNNLPTGKSVKASYLENGLSTIKNEYGTVRKYLTDGLGLDASTLDALQKKLHTS